MRVRIHRGANEIGGSCVEIEAGGDRIVLDVGKPLWADWDEKVPLPDVPGLSDGSDRKLRGVLISHPHLDHFGLIDQIDGRIPLFIGREAAALLGAAAFFSGAGAELHPAGHLRDRVTFELGQFSITPYLMDHSAFDSYSLLVEANGRRLIYSGDIRGHGRKSHLFDRLLCQPPKGIDVLLCEGTHIRHGADVPERALSEEDVEKSLTQRMRDSDGAVCVISSAQNIDRLVSVYRASKRAGRTLVTDLYTATLASAIGRKTIPQPGYSDYKVYVPNHQRILVRESGEFDRMALVKSYRVFPEWLAEHAGELTLLLPSSTVHELLRAKVLSKGIVVWSLWPGYLRDPSGARLIASLEAAEVPLLLDHASGHAPVADLQRLVTALNPSKLVPIHTKGAERYEEFFNHVEVHRDGEWWSA
jgi:ribonuclease J